MNPKEGSPSMGHTFSRILFHVIFCTKDRRNSLYQQMRGQLLNYMAGVAQKEGVQVRASGGVDDHVHLLLALKPIHSPSEVTKKIKANSSRWVHGKYKDLSDFGWQAGFSVFSVSQSAEARVIDYIRNQEKHHRRIPFAQELKQFLDKHEISYDPNHFLD
jgi:REP element-mobilizing transposase RayT